MKRFLPLAICLCIVLSALLACAEKDPSGSVDYGNSDYIYEKTDDGVVLLFYKGEELDVTVPEEIEGSPVVEIAPECFLRSNITSIVIPESVKSIGSFAFRSSYSLASVTVSDSLEYVGVYAFIDTPWYKNNTDEFLIIGDGVLVKYNGTSEEIVIPENVRSISCTLGSDTVDVTSITIPENIKYICGNAFVKTSWRRSLTDEYVIVGDGILIKYNGEGGDVTIPDNVKSISGAFYDNSKITSVVIPDSVNRIESYSFACMSGFSQSSAPKQVSSLTSVDISDSVEYIGCSAFFNCDKLADIKLSNSIRYINPQTFTYCRGIETLEIPAGVLSIGYTSFGDAVSMKQIVFPEDSKLRFIGDGAFFGVTAMTEISIPDGCRYIAGNAFVRCTSLESAVIPDGIETVVDTAFDGCAENFTVVGSTGSEAERFAKDNGYNFSYS